MDLHRLVHFVRHALRAQCAACQTPDDHVLKSRLARAVEIADQCDVPVDVDDEVFGILVVRAAMPAQAAETVGVSRTLLSALSAVSVDFLTEGSSSRTLGSSSVSRACSYSVRCHKSRHRAQYAKILRASSF